MSARRWALALLAVVVTASASAPIAVAQHAPVPGSQGTDTSLPLTDSAVTVHGRDQFARLAITVNQTRNLTNQAVSITWTGGTPTLTGPGRFAAHFLQVMQCWGDDDGTVPENPGPPPEQCVQGAVAGTFGGVPGGIFPGGLALTRVISQQGWENYDPSIGVRDARTADVWRPFHAVDGTSTGQHVDSTFLPFLVGGNYWLNPWFGIATTNEIAGAVTGPDGRGSELFEVHTGVESSGLGCGQRVQPVEGGELKIPKCWIVVVPRGAPSDENLGTPFADRADQFGVFTSPVSPEAWQHRIAVPVEFNPVDTPCSIGDVERRIVGNELLLPAVGRWQPALCAGGELPPYSYATTGDTSARQQLAFAAPGAPGLVVVSRPLPPPLRDPDTPVVYAPLSASGVAIGFNVERNPHFNAPEAAHLLAGVRVAELNLTPRLVAKLLTQSYTQQLAIVRLPEYEWLAGNPQHPRLDPDFLQFNPEFADLQIFESRTFSGLQLPAGNSDAARQVWEWVLADPEARAWLDGEPDPWGMQANPMYATRAEKNPTGVAFADPVPDSFPKSDPYCYQPSASGSGVVPPALCGTDWMPYTRGFGESAAITRRAFDGARITENPFAQAPSEAWSRGIPQFAGRRSVLAVTDTASAAQYGVQVARLSRAGDNRPDRTFIAPDAAGLAAGVASMVPGDESQVLEPSPTSVAPGAYPLTTLTYAAAAPTTLDDTARQEYAAFVEYAAGPGQVPGFEPGRLPNGYVPLPEELRMQAFAAATLIRELRELPPPPQTTATTTTTSTTIAPASPAPATPAPAAPAVGPRPASASPPPQTTLPPDDSEPAEEVTDDGEPTEEPEEVEESTTETPVASETTSESTDPQAGVTPDQSLGVTRFVAPALGALTLTSALGALEISKRPRRSAPDGETNGDGDEAS